MDFERIPKKDIFCKFECGCQSGNHRKFTKYGLFGAAKSCRKQLLGCVVNRFVLYYANVKKGYRENGECIRTT